MNYTGLSNLEKNLAWKTPKKNPVKDFFLAELLAIEVAVHSTFP